MGDPAARWLSDEPPVLTRRPSRRPRRQPTATTSATDHSGLTAGLMKGAPQWPSQSSASPRRRSARSARTRRPYVDYKDTDLLRKFISDRGKIRARRVTGNCIQHQRDVAIAIKNAREMALLPYTSTLAERRRRR